MTIISAPTRMEAPLFGPAIYGQGPIDDAPCAKFMAQGSGP